MKREKLKVIVIMFAALTLILAPLVLAPSPSILLPMATSQAVKAKNTAVTGQGANTTATLIITGNITHPGQANTSYGFDVPCPQNWGILNTTLTLNNVTAPNATVKLGERLSNETGSRVIFATSFVRAMSFEISTDSATLYNVSFYLDVERVGDGQLRVEIMNATWDPSEGKPQPNATISITGLNINEVGVKWRTCTYSPPLVLNSDDTHNRTFFVKLGGEEFGTAIAYWGYVSDNATYDDGYAYTKEDSAWSLENIDFKMRVFLDPGPVYPSEVELSIEEFKVDDVPGKRGVGDCTVIGLFEPQGEDVHFNASAVCEVYFNVTDANSTLCRNVNATTSYEATLNSVNWTVTIGIGGDHGFPEVGAGRFVSVAIPFDWWNSTPNALNITGGEATYLSNASGSLLFEATNGTWIIKCGAPNVLSSISVYALYEGKEPVEVIGGVVGDLISVKAFFSKQLQAGVLNLTVLSDGAAMFSNQTTFGDGSRTAEVEWNISEGVAPGSYTLRVFAFCGLEVGIIEKEFTVSGQAPCVVRIESFEGVVKPPSPVKVSLSIFREDTGFPVTGAQVSVYADGVALEADVTDYGNGTYLVMVTPPREGAYTLNITVSGSRITTVSQQIKVQYGEAAPGGVMEAALFMMAQSLQAEQSSRLLSLLGIILGLIGVSGGVAAQTYRKLRAPIRAMSAIENILVTHKESGLPLWSFDVFSMDIDVTLVSGFVSAVRNFAEEMKVGGFNVLETRLGTFVRAESELLEATCITGKVGRFEVEWLQGRLDEFLRLVEEEIGDALRKWKGGETGEFREVFRQAFSRVLDVSRLIKIHERKMSKLVSERNKLSSMLRAVEEEARQAGRLFEEGRLTPEEYEERVAKLSREKDVLEQRISSIDETLSRAKVRELVISGKMEEISRRFTDIRSEIDRLKEKEDKGELTEKEKRRLRKLEKELKKLVDELGRIEADESGRG